MEFPVEILLLVFSNARPRELATAARVFELVVPLVHNRGYSWSDNRRIGDKPTEFQWKRYDSYASRVRSIAFHDDAYTRRGRNSAITEELINSLARLHPRGAFCPPRLREIRWTSTHSRSVLAMVPFLCDTLQDLTARLHTWSGVERRLIEEAGGRTPQLKSLCLELSYGLESSLVQWLSKSPLLESVRLPTDYQTTAIVEALGDLAYLTRLKLLYQMYAMETTDQCFSFDSPSGFRRLEMLEIIAPIDRLVQLFQTSGRFAQVKKIALSSNNPTPEMAFKLTAALAHQCPGIAAITLDLRHPIYGEPDCSLSFQQTRPLLACHSLEIFKIETNKPFNEQDLRDMALAWPGIQELDLSPRPQKEVNLGGFPLQLLPIAAGLFPTLRSLGIYLDPEGDPPEFDSNTPLSSEFQSLRMIDVGKSRLPVDPSIDLGFIIGSLCKLEVWIVGEFESEMNDSNMAYEIFTEWSKIQDVVTMLVSSKRAMHEDRNVVPQSE